MPISAFQHSLAAVGFTPDMALGELPPQAWPDGQNMRFVRGAARTIEGSQAAHTVTTSVIHAINVYTATSNFWVCATAAAIFATDGTNVEDITRLSISTTTTGTVVPYTGTKDHNWTSCSFGNFLVLNNGKEPPQTWDLTLINHADNLDNWPATWAAQSVQTYRNYLVAMDITIGSDRYPSLVAWSDAATYDALPSSWVPATTNDAGDNNLNDTPGWIVDGLTLGGSFIIYKEDAIWAMTYAGGAAVMAFRKLFNGVGIFTRRCVVEFDGRHFFVGRGDMYVHDGVTLQSVATQRVREFFFDNINADTYERCFVVIDRDRREIWVCYPVGTPYPNRALIYNYETNVWYPPRTMNETAHIVAGIIDTSAAGTTFDGSVGTTFDADTGTFGNRDYNPSGLNLMACRPGATTIDRLNIGTQEMGVDISSYISRPLLPFDGQDATQGPTVWSPQMKLIRRVWLDATGTGTINVYLGTQDTESAATSWHGPFPVNLATQQFVWTLVRGRFISIKFQADSGTTEYALTGYKLEWEPVGVR